VYTTMSYNDGWQTHPSGSSPGSLNYGHQSGPGAFDIALIQAKYGASAQNSGNNVYVLPTANAAGTFWDVIWDTGGIDTIQHSGTLSATIDLTAATLDYSATGGGVISYAEGIFGGFTIASGVVIENAIGGSGNDTLIGNSGRNVLSGGGGADTMQGRLGNDIYTVNDIGDVVIEAANEGIDLVRSSVSYTLPDNVERLTLVGAAAISGTGNALNNVIIGNRAANTLTGGAGNDILNGGLGADTLVGGTGNDIYVVENVGDVVTEAAGEGIDLVKSSLSYTLGDNVERLTLIGTGAISGAGNARNNAITGNSAANELRGERGNDRLSGGGGADDINGGIGNDRLSGGAGADGFYFDTALNAVSNVDKILDFSAVADSIYLDQSIFTGIGALGDLAEVAFHLGTAAADADDRIIYDQPTGNLYYDADGNGAGSAILFAQLTPETTLSNLDFILI
nr:M10 family metallopeptidase C-terminal domain-containing protein [Sphingomonas sp.]